MVGCSAKVWPDYDWRRLLFVQVTNDKSLALSGKDGKIFEPDLSKIPAATLATEFGFFNFADSLALSINLDALDQAMSSVNHAHYSQRQIEEEVLTIAVHEAFHRLVQPSWVKDSQSSLRGTEVPIQVNPRLYRRMLFDRLREAFLNPSRREILLGQARFWFEKWKKEYPNEVHNTTDGYEGTAKYVEAISGALMKLGCEASEAVLRSAIEVAIDSTIGDSSDKYFGYSESGKVFELDGEGYDIGGLSAMILRFDFPQRNWWREVANGATPLEILLSGYHEGPDQADPAIEHYFQIRRAELQKDVDTLLAPVFSLLAPSDSIAVAIPSSWGTGGSFSPVGFYNDKKTGLQFIPLYEGMHFNSPAAAKSGSRLDAGDHTVWVVGLPSDQACAPDQTYWTTLIPRNAFAQQGGIFQISDAHLSGTMKGKLQTASDGRVWLCPEVVEKKKGL